MWNKENLFINKGSKGGFCEKYNMFIDINNLF